MRTVIDIPDKDLGAIKAMARRERISQAEAIRRAVRSYIEAQSKGPIDTAAFGIWSDREDGLVYQQALRDEWQR